MTKKTFLRSLKCPVDIRVMKSELERAILDPKNYSLGPIVKVHGIGDFAILEYHEVNGGEKFSAYVDGQWFGQIYDSLDEAVLGCFGYKYEGLQSRFLRYASRMLNMER